MSKKKESRTLPQSVTANPWGVLRQFTPARIALGRAGLSLPTKHHLEFQLAHSRARKAVHYELDYTSLSAGLIAGLEEHLDEIAVVHSRANSRAQYLQRPDLGRRLDDVSVETVQQLGGDAQPFDVALIIGDGLSPLAIETNVEAFLAVLLPALSAGGYRTAPLIVAQNARVALGDEISELLGARLAVMMIGERPGLSSPDSMGIYMTYDARIGRTDESRNCISNIRPGGLSYVEAAHRLTFLMGEAVRLGISGVELKDGSEVGEVIEES